MGQISSPNLTFTVTPPNGSPIDYTRYLVWSGGNQSMQITQNFGRQGDTATLVLADDWERLSQPRFYIPVLSQVKLTDNTINKVLFAGYATNVVQDVQGPTYNEWDLNCTDYTFLADNAIVQGTFIGYTVDQIVVALTTQANCGITAAQVKHGGFVAPGPQLASFVMPFGTLSDAWRKLATLASQVTPYGWYVDENKILHFYDATTAINSGVTFTMNPTQTGPTITTQGHWYYGNSFGYEVDGTSVKNKILVQGADQTFPHGKVPSSTPTDTFLGNGYQTSWALKYIVTGTPILHVGGKATTVDVVSAGGSSSATWQIVQNAIGTWFLTTTGSAPGSGTSLRVWYDYSVPVVAQAQDAASQSTYGLVLAEYINDSSLTTVPMALARAQRERTEYAFAVERPTFTTTEEWQGWVRAGETFTYVNAFIRDDQSSSWGVNDSFIAISNTISFVEGGYRQAQITGVRI